MKPFAVIFCTVAVVALLLLVVKAGEIAPLTSLPPALVSEERIDESVSVVNQWLRKGWSDEGLEPAELADDLTVYRRLSLALHGTIPSLEEVTAFKADTSTDRIERWLLRMLEDSRFSTYFADRIERVLTGVDPGQFIIFRRDRLRDWLSDQLAMDRPWHEMAADLIAADGLWTSEAASNFITAAFIGGEGLDENELAGRTVRAFLGQRIDCAQCHDHPFDSWKQQDFEGLAAFYGQARVTPGGVIDRPTEQGEPTVYRVIDPGEEEGRLVEPHVPFNEEWSDVSGSRRQQLAAWVVHPDNRRFERAISNRIWGLLFGRAWHDPVDDLAHPDEDVDDLLDVVGREFRRHNGSLKFLIRTIALSDAFRLRSDVSWADEDLYSHMSREWAVFPLVRLRPEQMIGSMYQAGRIRTTDQASHLFVRFGKLTNENDFLKEYGDAADDELLQQSGTIPQALLRMNGRFTRGFTETGTFSAAGQIMRHSGDDESVVQNCFLACLTRMPNDEERDFFVLQLQGAEKSDTNTDQNVEDGVDTAVDVARPRHQVVRDMYWVLFNSPDFSWNK
jgi:hypothetical protein